MAGDHAPIPARVRQDTGALGSLDGVVIVPYRTGQVDNASQSRVELTARSNSALA